MCFMVSKSYRAISVVFYSPKLYYRSSFSRTVCSRTLGPVVSLNELNFNNDISEDTSDRRASFPQHTRKASHNVVFVL